MTTNPIAHAQGDAGRPLRTGEGSGRGSRLERESDEVADLVNQVVEGVARNEARFGAQLLRTRQRTVAAVEQGAHVDDRRL